MALGTGLLIGSVSFELIDEAVKTESVGWVGVFTLLGAAVFTAGDWLCWRDRATQEKRRRDEQRARASCSARCSTASRNHSCSGSRCCKAASASRCCAACCSRTSRRVCRRRRACASSGWAIGQCHADLDRDRARLGRERRVGYAALDPRGAAQARWHEAFAAGALLTMVCDTMLPEAFEVHGVYTGSLVAIGFSVAIVLSSL